MDGWKVQYQNPQTARDRLIKHLRREIKDERVLAAIAAVHRERFVPNESKHLAYENIALPIGLGQTISQPLIVAMMTEALALKGHEKVLELGTGSGYQAAVLRYLAARVVSVERVPALKERAEMLLRDLGIANVEVRLAGAFLGWPAEAPYDGIIVTAAAPRVPQVLMDQLAPGGRLVIPVGSRWEQDLQCVTKGHDGFSVAHLGPCQFVPLIGEGAWPATSDDDDEPPPQPRFL